MHHHLASCFYSVINQRDRVQYLCSLIMPLHKKIVACDLSSKYGTKQRGLVTLEPIRRW